MNSHTLGGLETTWKLLVNWLATVLTIVHLPWVSLLYSDGKSGIFVYNCA